MVMIQTKMIKSQPQPQFIKPQDLPLITLNMAQICLTSKLKEIFIQELVTLQMQCSKKELQKWKVELLPYL